jgi:uncharacterized membrane protein YcaP (DUF421 family)
MDFFSAQETLTSVQWGLRALVGFAFLLLVAKLMGQRSISQLRFFDFVITWVLGNIIAHPLSDEGLGLKGSMITMSVLVILYVSGTFISLKWSPLRKLFDPAPIPLIENGQIHYKNLFKARISVDYLLSELRKEKTEALDKVALALWEPGGAISIFLDPKYQPVTPTDLNLTTEPFYLPKTVIKEKNIVFEELKSTGKEEQWLLKELKNTYNVELKNVLLATIDGNEKLKVILYK